MLQDLNKKQYLGRFIDDMAKYLVFKNGASDYDDVILPLKNRFGIVTGDTASAGKKKLLATWHTILICCFLVLSQHESLFAGTIRDNFDSLSAKNNCKKRLFNI